MKTYFSSLLFTLLLACNYIDKVDPPKKSVVIYELESDTEVPFLKVKYGGNSIATMKDWDVSGKGIFQKFDTVNIGSGVFFDVRHASSNKWKIRIKSPDASLLIEAPVKLETGPPSYYYSFIQVTIN
jgi:hypothetical protein